MSLRGRRAAVAIFKPKVWHPAAKHGAPARRISNISEIKMVGFIVKPTILCHCEAAARPRQSLSRRYGIPQRSTGAENDRIPKFRIVTERHHHGASPEAPFHAGASPHFTCVSIFHSAEGRISLRSLAVPRSGMPSRSVKDCRVGH